jgi:SEFIR domain
MLESDRDTNNQSTPPKVFISYGHDSQAHKDRILALAARLREGGIDADIDQYNPAPPEGWPRWMLDRVEKADFVLIACTERYDCCFQGKEEPGKGKGSTWEGGVIIQKLYDDQGHNSKFVPIIFTVEESSFIPSPLRGVTYYELHNDDGYNLLYRRLTSQPETLKPPLGLLQSLPPRDRQQYFLDENSRGGLKKRLYDASKGLLNWKRTLADDRQIPRLELERLKGCIQTEDSSTTILLGAPGSGKSALMAELGHWVEAENYVLLAIKADYLDNTIKTIEDLQRYLRLDRHLYDAIAAIADREKVVLLIDQLDAISELLDRNPERLNILLATIESLSNINNVHIVATCREFEFRHGSQFDRLDNLDRLDLSLPTWETIAPLLEEKQHHPYQIGESFRQILQNPFHLGIFLEVAKPGEVLDSLSKLLDRLWQKYILERSQAKKYVKFLEKIADRMTKEEVLWLPNAIGDDSPQIYQYLIRSGILIENSDNSTVGFRHQTYYDHTLARAYARESQSLTERVLTGQDSLFVRPVLLRSLTYLRGTDTIRYQKQLITFLKTEKQKIRYHIRSLLIEFIAAQSHPNPVEAELLIPLLKSPKEGIKVLDLTSGSPGWFDLFHTRSEFTNWLTKPIEKAIYCRPILAMAATSAPERVWSLLEEYCLHDRAYDNLSIVAIKNITVWTPERVVRTAEIIRRSDIGWNNVADITEKVTESLPNYAANIILAHLNYRLDRAIEASNIPLPKLPADASESKKIRRYRHNSFNVFENLLKLENQFYQIEEFAANNPQSFLASIWPWFIEVVKRLVKEPNTPAIRYREDDAYDLDLFKGDLIDSLVAAIVALVNQDKIAFLKFVRDNETSDLLVVHRLLAKGWEVIASAEPKRVMDYLLADVRRFSLGGNLHYHQETELLIVGIFPYLEVEDREKIEIVIQQFKYYHPSGNRAADLSRRYLEFNREHRLSLLKAIPAPYLSDRSRRLKEEEQRALPWVEQREHYSSTSVYRVGSRMTKAEMSRASDKALLNLFERLSDNTAETINRRESIDPSRSGDVNQQSREFGELVKDDPSRFFRLLSHLQPQCHERYVGCALENLAKTDRPPSDLLDLIADLDRQGFASEDFRSHAATALQTIATTSSGLPQPSISLLESWLPGYIDPKPSDGQDKEETSSDLKSPILFGTSGSHFLIGGRGHIIWTIADGYLRQSSPDLEGWAQFVRSQIDVETHPRIWVEIFSRMQVLLNGDRPEATELFDRIICNYPEVLKYPWALYSIGRLMGWFEPQETVRKWLMTIELDRSTLSQQAYGELLLIYNLGYQDEWSMERIRYHLALDNEAILCGLAHAASFLWARRECRAIATEILYTLASSSFPSVRGAVASIFQHYGERIEFDRGMLKIIEAVYKNKDLLSISAISLLEIIEERGLVDRHPKVVLAVCKKAIDLCKELTKLNHDTSHLAPSLTALAIRLHRQPKFRKDGLKLFERLLALNLRETQSALETLDRKPNRSIPYYATKRRHYRRS